MTSDPWIAVAASYIRSAAGRRAARAIAAQIVKVSRPGPRPGIASNSAGDGAKE